MQPQEVKSLLESRLAEARVEVTGDGSHFVIAVVSDAFEGLSRLKRQQLVYGALQAEIASGAIHAIDSMKTSTLAEWQASGD